MSPGDLNTAAYDVGAARAILDALRASSKRFIYTSGCLVYGATGDTPATEHGPLKAIDLVRFREALEGEILDAAAHGVHPIVIRPGWVYGNRGANFLLTMLRLAKERPELRIVADQFGAPTWSRTIADSTAMALNRLVVPGADGILADAAAWERVSGTYHLTCGGRTTWFEFAREIFAALPENERPAVVPIATSDYPVPASRPSNSSLDCSRFTSTFGRLPDWKEALGLCRG